jgi:hypothetical protein
MFSEKDCSMIETMYVEPIEEDSIELGGKVVLADGPYHGTSGVLLRLTEDANWAEVREWDDKVRRHPVVWLRRQP